MALRSLTARMNRLDGKGETTSGYVIVMPESWGDGRHPAGTIEDGFRMYVPDDRIDEPDAGMTPEQLAVLNQWDDATMIVLTNTDHDPRRNWATDALDQGD